MDKSFRLYITQSMAEKLHSTFLCWLRPTTTTYTAYIYIYIHIHIHIHICIYIFTYIFTYLEDMFPSPNPHFLSACVLGLE